jgi:hypothetical protein
MLPTLYRVSNQINASGRDEPIDGSARADRGMCGRFPVSLSPVDLVFRRAGSKAVRDGFAMRVTVALDVPEHSVSEDHHRLITDLEIGIPSVIR